MGMKKHKQWLSVLVTVSMLFVLAACGNEESEKSLSKWEKIKKEGTIVVGTAGTLYASSFHAKDTNKLTGYDVEIVREIADRLGLKVKFKEMGFDAMMPSLKSGKIDIAANDISITEERKKKFQFTIPYKYTFGTAIVRADGHSGIESLEDLKGKEAAGAANSIYSQIARKFGAKIVTYGNATNDVYLRDVDLGRTDVILNDYYLQKLALKALPQFDLVIHPDIKYRPSQNGIIMNKEADKLQKKMNEVLKEMKKDGTLTKLSKKFYSGMDVSKKPDFDIRKIELNNQK